MARTSRGWWLLAITCFLIVAQPAVAADETRGNLVTVQWLQKNLQNADLVLLDASPGPLFAKQHIPGAVNVDIFSFGASDPTPAEMEQRIRSWGISAGKKVVVYDQGATFMATRLFFDLYYHGFPAADMFILDGGASKWQEVGGAVTKEPTPAPSKGTFRVTRVDEAVRVRLPEFLVASGEPSNNVLVEALDPGYYFGETRFFDRAGHVPNAILFGNADFFNADKTFKSPEEIRRMATYLGIRPEQQIHSYCGGGIAASAPFFALKFIANYPKVKLYKESELEWLRDERSLPLWTYGAPYLKRDMAWVNGWNNPMMRMYGVTQLSLVDVRTTDAYKLGHVPFALSVPADVFRSHFDNPDKLAEALSAAGVNSTEEAVIVSDGGLNPGSALAFLTLERLGHKKVSILMDSVDEWALRGLPLTKDATIVGPKETPKDLAVPATVYRTALRPGVLIKDAGSTKGQYSKVFVASGKAPLAKAPDGKVIHVPYTDLLNADGTPKAAKDLWNILARAGVPRYAEIITVSDEPGEAAVNYFIFKLMGFPDVKVMVGAS
jgi:3-mercaptopyruvate sulfurtransferase SseA